MNEQFIFYNNKIEEEYRKPEGQRSLELIEDWKTERAKYSAGKKESSIHFHSSSPCFCLFLSIAILYDLMLMNLCCFLLCSP